MDFNEEVFLELKEKALEEKVPIVTDDVLDIIMGELYKIEPERILEIGTAVGYSAICFSRALSKDGRIDTLERDEERIKEAKKNIKNMNLESKIVIYEGDAVEKLPAFNEKYDAIFIDAAKGKYPFFLNEALRLLKPDGVIFADNILYKGYVMGEYNHHKQRTAVRNLREYISKITNDEKLDTKILEIGDGLSITRLK